MGADLLDVLPLELQFIVEAKRQSCCSVQLANKSDQHVAFKVKTTSPKKYCVRPNVGIIKPNETCDFTVTMQVQRAAPPDLQCKDKFLIQCTVVASGTTEEDMTSEIFAKDSGKNIEERKLRVILVCPPQSAVLAPVNGVPNQDSLHDTSQKDKIPSGVENLPPSLKESEEPTNAKPVETFRVNNDALTTLADSAPELMMEKIIYSGKVKNDEEIRPSQQMEEVKKESEELKLKMDFIVSKLAEAEETVAKLTVERSNAMLERETLRRELTLMKRKTVGKTVHLGFPLLYVCMVALISLTLGYLLQ